MDNAFDKNKVEKEAIEIKPEASTSVRATADKPEGREASREAEPVKEEAEREAVREEMEKIGKMTLSPSLKKQAEEEAVKIKGLDKEGKVSRLLSLVKEKGLVFAVDVAKKTGDAYLLDSLYDSLVKEGRFREFEK